MRKRGLLMLTGIVLAVAILAVPAGAEEPNADETIHPYPLYPFEPVPGRPGFGTPEIQPYYEAWRAALAAGDEKKAEDMLIAMDEQHDVRLFRSQHFKHGYPQFLAYPGSIEHIRADWQRYVPPYPLYNHHTLLENFILHEHPQTRDNTEEFVEPLYWIGQWNTRFPTSATRELEAYPWQPGESIEFTVGPLAPRRMYTVRVIAALDPSDVVRFRTVGNLDAVDPSRAEKQLVFRFEINDRPDGGVSTYYLRGRTWDQFYETVSCRFNAYEEREYTIRITLLEDSEATLYTYNVDVHNVFGTTAQRAGKERATTFDSSARRARWANRRATLEEIESRFAEDSSSRGMIMGLHHYHRSINDDYPEDSHSRAHRGESIDMLIDSIENYQMPAEERIKRDNDLWRSLPPINHMADNYSPRHHYDNPDDFEKAEEILRAGWAPASTSRRSDGVNGMNPGNWSFAMMTERSSTNTPGMTWSHIESSRGRKTEAMASNWMSP